MSKLNSLCVREQSQWPIPHIFCLFLIKGKSPKASCASGECVTHASCDSGTSKCVCDAGYDPSPTTRPTMCKFQLGCNITLVTLDKSSMMSPLHLILNRFISMISKLMLSFSSYPKHITNSIEFLVRKYSTLLRLMV